MSYEIPYHRPIQIYMGGMIDFNRPENKNKHILSNGSNVRKLEAQIKELYDVEHVIACSSASIGMLITLQAFHYIYKIGYMLTPVFAWYSSKWAIESVPDMQCIFQDIDKNMWLMKDEGGYNQLPIHTFGSIYESKGKNVIYDGAHALGSRIKDFGSATVFSLAPTKLITACEGGLILTNDEGLALEIKYRRDKVSRMSELNAIWGLETLSHLEEIIKWKRTCYYYYKNNLPGQFQEIPRDSNFATIGFLTEMKMPPEIEFRKYYVPLVSGFPNTNFVYGKMVCLPSWFGVDYEHITKRIIQFNERVDK